MAGLIGTKVDVYDGGRLVLRGIVCGVLTPQHNADPLELVVVDPLTRAIVRVDAAACKVAEGDMIKLLASRSM